MYSTFYTPFSRDLQLYEKVFYITSASNNYTYLCLNISVSITIGHVFRGLNLFFSIINSTWFIPGCPVATASHVGVNGTLALAPAVNGGASSAVYTGPMHCIASIYRQGGLRGCFRGFGATLLREVPGLSVYITTYEYLLDRFSSEGSNSIASPGIMLLAGGLAGTCSWFCNMPCDVIKSRIQADRIVNPEYNGIVDCIRKSYAKEGIRVFYRGLAITCIRAFPVNAVTFYVYKLSLNEFQVWAAEEELPE